MVVFGLEKDQWDVINGLANWLAAVGTISAVVLSLRLARASSSVRAKLSANARTIFHGDGSPGRPIIEFQLINEGFRPFEVVSLGWHYGKRKSRRSFVQLFNWNASSPLPLRLQETERGAWHFQTDQGAVWYTRMSGEFSSDWKRELRSLRAFASLSTGESIECSPDPFILEQLRKSLIARTI